MDIFNRQQKNFIKIYKMETSTRWIRSWDCLKTKKKQHKYWWPLKNRNSPNGNSITSTSTSDLKDFDISEDALSIVNNADELPILRDVENELQIEEDIAIQHTIQTDHIQFIPISERSIYLTY